MSSTLQSTAPSLTADYPRASLGHFPTPLEALTRLSTEAGSQKPLWVKRDDCTGLAFGGNKVRQLEFYFGDALAQGATLALITGAVQSNFVRTAAASAAKLGLKCLVQLEERVAGKNETYSTSGNVLLNHLLGARVEYFPVGEDEHGADAALEQHAAHARAAGEVPYVIHLSEQPGPLGTLGYVVAVEELVSQAASMGLELSQVVVASGSAVTHAGVLVGLRALGCDDVRVVGACVRREADAQRARVMRVAQRTEELIGHSGVVRECDVVVDDTFLDPGYGHMNAPTRATLLSAARTEALLVDPVYTAKSLACALEWVKRDDVSGDTVFMHTGGTPALFGYATDLWEMM